MFIGTKFSLPLFVWGRRELHTVFLVENPKEKDNLENLHIDENMIKMYLRGGKSRLVFSESQQRELTEYVNNHNIISAFKQKLKMFC
jgi:hypothetical protein